MEMEIHSMNEYRGLLKHDQLKSAKVVSPLNTPPIHLSLPAATQKKRLSGCQKGLKHERRIRMQQQSTHPRKGLANKMRVQYSLLKKEKKIFQQTNVTHHSAIPSSFPPLHSYPIFHTARSFPPSSRVSVLFSNYQ